MQETPKCIGIILDGNRRWAKEHGLPKLEGHRKGFSVLLDTVRAARELGIQHVVVYMFSTENWNRDPEEVSYLMALFKEMGEKHLLQLGDEGIRIQFVGQRERFSSDLQEMIATAEEKSVHNTDCTLWACLSYGGRAELVQAAQKAAEEGVITEESITAHLWTAGMPDPDIIIRTGGEKRLSNFLLWQGAYSELFFVDAYWPDFTKEKLEEVLVEYTTRQRRMGR